MSVPDPVEVIRAPALATIPHGFLGRRGGVSTGIHAGLNVGWGSDDERAAIAENRRRAVEAVLPGAALVTVHQVHSADVVTVTAPWPDPGSSPGQAARPKADALVTNRPGLLLGILTADCAPVLLADVQAGVVGAAHAGWKGALAGVTDATIAAMEALGAKRDRIAAAIGPCIAQASYEVDDDFEARFLAAEPEPSTRSCRAKSRHLAQGQGVSTSLDTSGVGDVARFFKPGREGHAWFDLEGYVAMRLAAAGIATVEKLALDTYADDQRFYSYRRATHRGEPGYGREISVIGLL